MGKYKKYTFSVPLNDITMERFDSLRGPIDRSQALRMVLQHMMSYDGNFIRAVLGLPNLPTPDQVVENVVQAQV